MGKKKASGVTKPSQFRLKDHTLKDLDFIAAYLAKRDGTKQTRTSAIELAIKRMADAIREEDKK